MTSHNIGYQMQTAINNAFSPGMDKYSLKHNGEAINKVCSFSEKKSLQEVVYQFKDFMKENYKITMVRDIKTEHWQAFLIEKAKTCGYATLKNYISRIKKIEVLCNNKYKINVSWNKDLLAPLSQKTKENQLQRIKMMDQKDYNRVMKYGYQYCSSAAIPAIEICYKYGLRVSELAGLSVKSVDSIKMEIHVIGKGGRRRDLKINKDDIDFFKNLMKDKNKDDKLIGIKQDSINKELNRILTILGLKSKYSQTSIHSIRKLFAQRMWDKFRSEGYTREETMNMVSNLLGHGKGRYDIITIYVKNPH